MDVLVKWADQTLNVVSSTELEIIQGEKLFTVGKKVRMFWKPTNKFYFGTIVNTEKPSTGCELEEYSEDDDLPLTTFLKSKEHLKNQKEENEKRNRSAERAENVLETASQHSVFGCTDQNEILEVCKSNKQASFTNYEKQSDVEHSGNESVDPVDDSDVDPTYDPNEGHCGVPNCNTEVWSSCHRCLDLLCYSHFINLGPCTNFHLPLDVHRKRSHNHQSRLTVPLDIQLPEEFVVEGCRREEGALPITKKPRENKREVAHERRSKGIEYTSPNTGKIVPTRTLKPTCDGISCTKLGRQCSTFSEDERKKILSAYYSTASLQLQREYIVRYVKREVTKQKTSKQEISRRNMSQYYYLPKMGEHDVMVCKTMFLNTLSISERTMRTALEKKEECGTIETEKRGGRPEALHEQDQVRREAILRHISRFPRMESHYCRKSSTREYLHSDLNKQKMRDMFVQEHKEQNITASYKTYCDVLKTQNLSFFHPKKDKCGLCETYRKGDADKKAEMQTKMDDHQRQKQAVRDKKKEAKEDPDPMNMCATFDMQQVIFLPKTNDSMIFYKRRLANYNLTIYDLKSKQCHCFTWHEGMAKRGSCEVATCLKHYLQERDNDGANNVTLFSDGCPGQNKNSIVTTMLLHFVCNSRNIDKISLHFFEPYHGQNEGDSAHSCINTAIEAAGDLYVPSQLVPIFRLARRKNPYVVHSLQTGDFYDYKTLAHDLRILSVRIDDKGDPVDWTTMRQVMVQKSHRTKVFFADCHLTKEYRSITLKRGFASSVSCSHVPKLYQDPPKIPSEKFRDLMAMCHGETPVVSLPEHVLFYDSLPHL